jgi:hypothetical protein
MKKFLAYFFYSVIASLVLIFIARQIVKESVKKMPEVILRYEDNYSLTYAETIEALRALSKKHLTAKLLAYGNTDIGQPLHLFVISKTKNFSPSAIKEKGFRVIMVNNGIHPGEPCGVDASVKLARDILANKDGLWEKMDSTILCIIPIYNVGGALNRSPYTRANQNGPSEQGFRANAKNLDLNRDYAPMKSKNAQSFAKIFHQWKPDLLIDTHTTNGADYQYVMTLIPPHAQELPPMLGSLLNEDLEPFLYNSMKESGYEMIPYVSPMGQSPENGLQLFLNSPRYTTGYGRLFNTITFTTEAHMFKPFKDRVLATYEFIKASINYSNDKGALLTKAKDQSNEFIKAQKEFTIRRMLDTTRFEEIEFKGYESEYIDSKITGGKRLRYNRDKPFTKNIPYYKHYLPKLTITTPDYYVIPQAWNEVIFRLTLNGVKVERIERDTLMSVESFYITSYDTQPRPYNGNYLHYNVEVRTEVQSIQFFKGDYLVPTNQVTNLYIVEMLEPQADDSFFAWNFFDSVLQRKEYFSPYVFEDFAEQMLNNDAELRKEFENKKKSDKQFANNSYSQLTFLYERSPYFEKSYMRYPVYKLNCK